jgi:hypothetical protein
MMRIVRGTTGTLLAATLLTCAIGLQVLEATGHWDRTFQDTGDEAAIVTAVLCIGAAFVLAAARRPHIRLVAIDAPVVFRPATGFALIAPLGAPSFVDASPPLSLRI